MPDAPQVEHQPRCGSPLGLIIVVLLGFALYYGLNSIQGGTTLPDYDTVIKNIHGKGELYWFFMNFTEANFFAGFCSSLLIIIGAAIAWGAALRGSALAGFEICYGNARIWPWVFASQVLTLSLVMFGFNYMSLFKEDVTWIPTFIAIVNVPPALTLIYGPGIVSLLTTSVLGALICTPVAVWLSKVFAPWNVPGVVSNVGAMAIAGTIAASACQALPWMKKKDIRPITVPIPIHNDTQSATWLIRRTLADFTEPLFYGNDLAGFLLLIGVFLDTMLNPGLSVYGGKCIGAIVLSEIIAGSVGVFLYAGKWKKKGWYATYVPVVSTAPACVLMFGATIPVALFSAVLGAILGAPLAEFFANKIPDYVPGTVANVTSMAITTIIVAVTMQILPWF
ncbi:hypothetical protein RAH42_02950 [Pyramidobacter sp. YE332]|uniref:hypothetical protein n=1 Tax=unclassified Pyramidobacter TaxID=2632171 RepID=UPI00098EF0DE|nr:MULTISPECIES: hypothetical protein [unclassified Pyramidobacter]WOL40608.1 hypothetical protein RAH42_02950 [Pyramidobacter sp. YE332]